MRSAYALTAKQLKQLPGLPLNCFVAGAAPLHEKPASFLHVRGCGATMLSAPLTLREKVNTYLLCGCVTDKDDGPAWALVVRALASIATLESDLTAVLRGVRTATMLRRPGRLERLIPEISHFGFTVHLMHATPSLSRTMGLLSVAGHELTGPDHPDLLAATEKLSDRFDALRARFADLAAQTPLARLWHEDDAEWTAPMVVVLRETALWWLASHSDGTSLGVAELALVGPTARVAGRTASEELLAFTVPARVVSSLNGAHVTAAAPRGDATDAEVQFALLALAGGPGENLGDLLATARTALA